jgi:hypothetical protein
MDTNDTIERLEGLEKLLDLGVITQEEFEVKKQEILHPQERKEEAPETFVVEISRKDEPRTSKADRSLYRGIPEDKPPKKRSPLKGILIALAVILVLGTAAYFVPQTGFRCLLKGHVPEDDYVIVKAPTCVEAGKAETRCAVCGKVVNTTKLSPVTTHDYVNGVCAVCGAKDPGAGNNNKSPLYRVRTLVELHVRTGPGMSYSVNRNLPYLSVVDVYETKKADGYTWNRINDTEWVANDGTWLEKVN